PRRKQKRVRAARIALRERALCSVVVVTGAGDGHQWRAKGIGNMTGNSSSTMERNPKIVHELAGGHRDCLFVCKRIRIGDIAGSINMIGIEANGVRSAVVVGGNFVLAGWEDKGVRPGCGGLAESAACAGREVVCRDGNA